LPSILINSENYLFEVDFKRLKNLKLINERYEYLLEKKNLSKGQRNFLVTILALETNAELIAFDETLDSITGKMQKRLLKVVKK
jgi:ABC-type sugar transport system ATPase subunit